MIKFTIPTPCHEDWNKMTANSQGAFCGSCQKNVVDFTKLSDDEVLNYLNHNLHKETCGRIEVKQLDRINLHIDNNILYSNISTWKKYLAIILICFGAMIMGCNNNRDSQIQGGMILKQVEMVKKEDTIINPTQNINPIEIEENTIVGNMAMPYSKPVVQGGMSIIQENIDTIKTPILDSSLKTFTEKIDSTFIKDSLKIKPDTCANNTFNSI